MDEDERNKPVQLKIVFNGTAEELQNLMAMLEKLRLPGAEAPPPENQYSALKGGTRTTAQAQRNNKRDRK